MKTTTGRLGLNLLIWAGTALLAASACSIFSFGIPRAIGIFLQSVRFS